MLEMPPNIRSDRLLIPRNKFDPEVEALPLPEASLPLPRWQDLPLDAKFPVTPAPKGELTFVTTKLCQPAYRSHQHVTFDLTDPYNRKIQSDYNALTDPNIRSWLAKPENKKHIRSQNLVTEQGQIPCNIREFNNYRKYVRHQALLTSREKEEALEKAAERRKKILQETRAKAELVGAEVRYRVIRAQHRAKELEDEKKQKLAEKQAAETKRQFEREQEEHFKRQKRFSKNSMKLEDKHQELKCKEEMRKRELRKLSKKYGHNVAANNNHATLARERQAAFEAKKREKWENKRMHQEKLLEEAQRRRERAQAHIRSYKSQHVDDAADNTKTKQDGDLLENDHQTSPMSHSCRTDISVTKNNTSRKSSRIRKEVEKVKRLNGPNPEVAKSASRWVVEDVLQEQGLSKDASKIASSKAYSEEHVDILDHALDNAVRDVILGSATSSQQQHLSEIMHLVVRIIQQDKTSELANLVTKLSNIDASRDTEETWKVVMRVVPDDCIHVKGHFDRGGKSDPKDGHACQHSRSWTADSSVVSIEEDLREFLDVLQQEPMKSSELQSVLRTCLQLASRETIDDEDTRDQDSVRSGKMVSGAHNQSENKCTEQSAPSPTHASVWSIEKQISATRLVTTESSGCDKVDKQSKHSGGATVSQGNDQDNTSADLKGEDLAEDVTIAKRCNPSEIERGQGNVNTNFNQSAGKAYTTDEDCEDSLRSSRHGSPDAAKCLDSPSNLSDEKMGSTNRRDKRRNRGRLSREGSISPNKHRQDDEDPRCHGDCDSRRGSLSPGKSRSNSRHGSRMSRRYSSERSESSSDENCDDFSRRERLSPGKSRRGSHSAQSYCSQKSEKGYESKDDKSRNGSVSPVPSRSATNQRSHSDICHYQDSEVMTRHISDRSYSSSMSESVNSLNQPMNTVEECTDDATSASSLESDDDGPVDRENKIHARRLGGSVVALSRRMLRRIQDRCKNHVNDFALERLHRFIALSASRLWRTSIFTDTHCHQVLSDAPKLADQVSSLLANLRSLCLPKDFLCTLTKSIAAVLIVGLGDGLERYLTDGVVRAVIFRFCRDLHKNIVDSRILCNVLSRSMEVFNQFKRNHVDFQISSFFMERLTYVIDNISSYTPTANRQFMEALGCNGPDSPVDAMETYYGNWRMISHKVMAVLRLQLLTLDETRKLKDMLVQLGAELLFSEGVNDPQDVIELVDYRSRDKRFNMKSSLMLSAHAISVLLPRAKQCDLNNATLLPGGLRFYLHAPPGGQISRDTAEPKTSIFFMLLNNVCRDIADNSLSSNFLQLFATYIKDWLFGATLVVLESDILWVEVKKLASTLRKHGKVQGDIVTIIACAVRAKLENAVYKRKTKALKGLGETHKDYIKLLLSEAISGFMNHVLSKMNGNAFANLDTPTELLQIFASLAQEGKRNLTKLCETVTPSFPGHSPTYDWLEIVARSAMQQRAQKQKMAKTTYVDTVAIFLKTITPTDEDSEAQMYVPRVDLFNVGHRRRRGCGVVNSEHEPHNKGNQDTTISQISCGNRSVVLQKDVISETNGVTKDRSPVLTNILESNTVQTGESCGKCFHEELIKMSDDVMDCVFNAYDASTADTTASTIHLLERLISRFYLRLLELRKALIKGKVAADQVLPFLFYTTPGDTKGIHPDNLSIQEAIKLVTSVTLELEDVQASLRQGSRLVEAIDRSANGKGGKAQERILGATSATTMSHLICSVMTSLCHSVICLTTASPTIEVLSLVTSSNHPAGCEPKKGTTNFAFSIVQSIVYSYHRVVESEYNDDMVWLPSNISGSGQQGSRSFNIKCVAQVFESIDSCVKKLKWLQVHKENDPHVGLYSKLCSDESFGQRLNHSKLASESTPELVNKVMLQLFCSVNREGNCNILPPVKINTFTKSSSPKDLNDVLFQSKHSRSTRQNNSDLRKLALPGELSIHPMEKVALNEISENIQTKLSDVILALSKTLKSQVGAALFENDHYDAKLRGAACLDALYEKMNVDYGRQKVTIVPAKIEMSSKMTHNDSQKYNISTETKESPAIVTIHGYIRQLLLNTADMAGTSLKDVAQFCQAISEACHLVNLDTLSMRQNTRTLMVDSLGDIEVLLVEMLRSGLQRMFTHQKRQLMDPRDIRQKRRRPEVSSYTTHRLPARRQRRSSKANLNPYIGDISERWRKVSDLQRDVFTRKRTSESICSRTESIDTSRRRNDSYNCRDKNRNKRLPGVSNEGSSARSASTKNYKNSIAGLTKETAVYSFVQKNTSPVRHRPRSLKIHNRENPTRAGVDTGKSQGSLATNYQSHDENDTLDDISHDNIPFDSKKFEMLKNDGVRHDESLCKKMALPLIKKSEKNKLFKATKTSSLRTEQHSRKQKYDFFPPDEPSKKGPQEEEYIQDKDDNTCIDMIKEESSIQFPDSIPVWQRDGRFDKEVTPVIFKLLERELPLEIFVLRRCMRDCPMESLHPSRLVDFIATIDHLWSRREEMSKQSDSDNSGGVSKGKLGRTIGKDVIIEELGRCTGVSQRAAGAVHNLLRNVESGRLKASDLETLLPPDKRCGRLVESGQDFIHELTSGLLSMVERAELGNKVPEMFIDNPEELIKTMEAAADELEMRSNSRSSDTSTKKNRHATEKRLCSDDSQHDVDESELNNKFPGSQSCSRENILESICKQAPGGDRENEQQEPIITDSDGYLLSHAGSVADEHPHSKSENDGYLQSQDESTLHDGDSVVSIHVKPGVHDSETNLAAEECVDGLGRLKCFREAHVGVSTHMCGDDISSDEEAPPRENVIDEYESSMWEKHLVADIDANDAEPTDICVAVVDQVGHIDVSEDHEEGELDCSNVHPLPNHDDNDDCCLQKEDGRHSVASRESSSWSSGVSGFVEPPRASPPGRESVESCLFGSDS